MKKGCLRSYFVTVLAIVACVFLASCGERDDEDSTGTGNTASISLSAGETSIPADGASSTTITATLKDSLGAAVEDGTLVTFSATLGTFPSGDTTYTVSTSGESGSVVISLLAGTTPGDSDIAASSNSVTQSITITFDSGGGNDTGATVSLATSQVSVKSDNSDSATITATVLDEDNVVAEGVTVSFSTDGGQISESSVDTDENGQAIIVFSSGTVDKTNQVATITAQVAGIDPVQIPIQVTGTTVSLYTQATNITVGSSETLTVTVTDAGSVGIYNASVTISASPAGVLSVSQAEQYTDVSGTMELVITGTGVGDATVTVESLGATATQTYTIGTVGDVFGISSPPQDPSSLDTNTPLPIIVNAPDQTSVDFVTTFGGLIGGWDGTSNLVVTKAVSGGVVSATLTSDQAGTANIQVSDSANSSITDTCTVVISAPSSEAANISIQSNAYILAPSTGDVSNSVALSVTVKNGTNQVVSGAPISFSIENPTGGGETVSPVIVYTNDYGIAASTFTSGSLSSDAEGVTVRATVVGTTITDSLEIVIGGTAGSVVIGVSTEISSNESETVYIYPMSVLIADTNGNPVSNATVTLSVWPNRYATGYWDADEDLPVWTGQFANEDLDQNLILDFGEDVNGDGELTPPSSASGTLPGSVTTDEYGVANFELVYLKSSAVWIEAKVTASTEVFGSEYTSNRIFWLPYRVGDEEHLSNSPYGM